MTTDLTIMILLFFALSQTSRDIVFNVETSAIIYNNMVIYNQCVYYFMSFLGVFDCKVNAIVVIWILFKFNYV